MAAEERIVVTGASPARVALAAFGLRHLVVPQEWLHSFMPCLTWCSPADTLTSDCHLSMCRVCPPRFALTCSHTPPHLLEVIVTAIVGVPAALMPSVPADVLAGSVVVRTLSILRMCCL